MLSADALRAHLLAAGLAGSVRTSREVSLRRYRHFAARDPRVLLGLDPDRDWPLAEVVALMARRCGGSADPAVAVGGATIDPDRTIAGLDALAGRLRKVADTGGTVLFGTGHPDRLLDFYAVLARSVSAAGGVVLTPARGRDVDMTTRFGVRTHRLDYVGGVALVQEGGARPRASLTGVHSHSPLPVRLVLGAAAEAGGPLPELVVGDHGWVCGAGQLGFEAVGLADVDDPAVFVGVAEGRVAAVVPVEDGAEPGAYLPLAGYVRGRAGLPE
ncbi:phosphatase [Streptomyces sp. BI20]|uniref:phosphatase n=1 Tax=Streptomyces sp. BI20 TaxID=3403460 RepID=UPI003C793A9C